ncbi:MAG: CBS domain-containing protein [Methanobacteriota archaeon]|nr:MAG: CBS domain-containing protein [Euryarchaeota archaeon]
MVLYAKDILEPEFISMRPQTSLLEAAKRMADQHQGFVIVTSPEGRPIGIVTEWDILAKVVAVARNPAQVTLEELMTRSLVYVDANEGIDRVAEIMADKGVRRVLVEKDRSSSQPPGIVPLPHTSPAWIGWNRERNSTISGNDQRARWPSRTHGFSWTRDRYRSRSRSSLLTRTTID